ncbi:MAG: hypothetical protein AAF004_03640 [Pseudomonadota bacterium]
MQSASDVIYHGTTETMGQPSVGINAQWQPNDWFFAGFEAHTARVKTVRQRQNSYSGYVGGVWTLNDQWAVNLSVQHREFPGGVKAWEFTELKTELSHENGFKARLDYSPNYYAHKTESYVAEFGGTTFFRPNLYYEWQIGAVTLQSERFTDYQYARLGIGYTRQRMTLDLSYGWNSEDGQPQFGLAPLRSPRVLAKIFVRLF